MSRAVRRRRPPRSCGSSRTLGLASGLLLLGATALARADAYDAVLTRAIAAKERALDANEPARWEEALRLFRELDAIRATPEAKYELARAAQQLRQHDLAIESYRAALALGLEGAAREKAASFVAAEAAKMAELEVRGPLGARVMLRGLERGTLPLARPLVVFAGSNSVELVSGSGERMLRSVEVRSGERAALDFGPAFLAPPPASPPPSAPSSSAPDPVTEAPSSAPAGAWELVVAGAGLTAASAVTVVLSSLELESSRDDLDERCALQATDDECETPLPGQRENAQADVDSIATWKAVRVGAWIGVGTGLIASAIGFGSVLRAERQSVSRQALPRPRPSFVELRPLAGGFGLEVGGTL